MAIQGIESAVQQLQLAARAAGGVSETQDSGGDFAGMLSASLAKISDTQNQARVQSEAFATGNSALGLNDVMVDLQKSSISLQTGVQVRNKLVSAYQEMMNMSV
ncbi:flagellar hook-basal body complex protein FliE [Acerihabitans arboris]|uniref:Flagellar hook-basal body complex protein FliE n=1 Tax=Acerihabitans arboris TaxID=2691583 RepID=A0A845SFE9_9GAMM|nr:flagellar hook-basal body complex protein FliE [Acerihabitans arboris]NDL62599.1 flagellar hook-basal body complex protein FliE [Acerihabitans arboris]